VDSDGTKVVYMQVRDAAGNTVNASDDIFLDRKAPENLTILINGGASITSSTKVSLSISASDPAPASGLYKMSLREKGGPWGQWINFTTTMSFDLSTGDGTKTVELRVMDRAGNIAGPVSDSIVLDTTPPRISNIRVVSITSDSAVVTWTTDSPADSTVEYGLDTSYGSTVRDAQMVTSHSVSITGLSPDTLYHFRVLSTDQAGNGPTVSEDHTFRTKKLPDTTPPVISNLRVEGITDSLAIVSWDTNEVADAMVEYGTDTTYGHSVSDSRFLLHHSLTLTGLQPMTTYFFKVYSKDPSGNGPATADGNFTTSAAPDTEPPNISDVRVAAVTDTSAVITWRTDEPADSTVEYGESTTLGSTATDNQYVTFHSVLLSDLRPSTEYWFKVASTDPTGNGPAWSSMYSFRTEASPDTVPPQIANVRVEGITATQALVLWSTDEPSDSMVEYWDTGAHLTVSDSMMVSEHSILLTGLKSSTTYHFRVASTDLSGNGPSWSEVYTFTTGSISDTHAPVILWVKVAGLSDRNAVVMWMTDEVSDSYVEVGLSPGNYTWDQYDAGPVVQHSMVLSNLTPNTTYYFHVASTDISGNGPTCSEEYSFTTLAFPDITPPNITNLTVTVNGTTAVVTWHTDEPARTILYYGKVNISDTLEFDTYTFEHRVELSNLAPGTYAVMPGAVDASGNSAKGELRTFTVEREEPNTPPEPGPGSTKGPAGEFPWWILLLVAAAAVLGAAYVLRRKKEGVEELDMAEEDIEDLDMEEPADEDIEELDMKEPVEELDMAEESPLKALAAEGEIDVEPEEPEPIRRVRCPGCGTSIPIYSASQTDITCPSCGKKGKLKPTGQKTVKCPACGSRVPVTSTERPLRITCPNCGRSGVLK